VAGPTPPRLPFEQAYYPGGPLTIGFESERVTSSDDEVDLVNSGINQILSVAAVRGHRLLHFSIADLHGNDGQYFAEAAILALDPTWDGADAHHAHRHLEVVDRRAIPLAEVQLYFVRGDDIRTERTPNIEILQWAAAHAKLLESVEATLSTTDKYATIERSPQLPHPVTFAAATTEQALGAIERLPHDEPWFVLKDRYGYGGAHVHRLGFDDPDLEVVVARRLGDYGHVLVQEFRPEVRNGDLVVTFFDDELIGSLRRIAPPGDWRTNASIGADEVGVTLTPEQESIARALKRSFPECRLASVDMLESGHVLEINAFPGAEGLLSNYKIVLGEIVLDRLEEELLGKGVGARGTALTWKAERPARFPTGTRWPEVDELYPVYEGEREMYDVLSGDRFRMGIRELIEFDPRSPEYIVSIPHAGVLVPEAFRDRFPLDESSLLEIDLYSDLCYEMTDGMHLRSELAPFFVDMNRTREGADAGELPHHLTNPAHEYYSVEDRLLLRGSYTQQEEEEVLAYHDLYHSLLDRLIDRMRSERGYALLFDCHSMTSKGLGRVRDKGRARADFVAGTLHGTSAHEEIIDAFVSTLSDEAGGHGLGLSVARDVPYSGGFITRHHHDPDGHVHVIQLEVAMDAYMYEAVAAPPKRYALKRPRLRIVRRTIQEAFRSAAEAAERIHH